MQDQVSQYLPICLSIGSIVHATWRTRSSRKVWNESVLLVPDAGPWSAVSHIALVCVVSLCFPISLFHVPSPISYVWVCAFLERRGQCSLKFPRHPPIRGKSPVTANSTTTFLLSSKMLRIIINNIRKFGYYCPYSFLIGGFIEWWWHYLLWPKQVLRYLI